MTLNVSSNRANDGTWMYRLDSAAGMRLRVSDPSLCKHPDPARSISILAVVADAERAFVLTKPLAKLIQLRVFRRVGLAKRFIGGARPPFIERDESIRIIGALEQFGADEVAALAEKLNPQSFRTVHVLELIELFGSRVELPDKSIHRFALEPPDVSVVRS